MQAIEYEHEYEYEYRPPRRTEYEKAVNQYVLVISSRRAARPES